MSFSECGSLRTISFESNSKLSRIEGSAFSESGLRSIHLPASLEVICESCFSHCKSLESISFAPNSKLSRIEGWAFCASGLLAIHLPAAVLVIYESCFSECKSLGSVIVDGGSKLCESQFSALFRARFPDAFSRVIDGSTCPVAIETEVIQDDGEKREKIPDLDFMF
jgi:hypothetical protein